MTSPEPVSMNDPVSKILNIKISVGHNKNLDSDRCILLSTSSVEHGPDFSWGISVWFMTEMGLIVEQYVYHVYISLT